MKVEDVQKKAYDILKAFIKVCEKNDLKYYLGYGSFLGAVRHKGFIPWDDDIDVLMPREDYNKFCEIVNNELPSKYKFVSFENNNNYRFYSSRIVDSNTKLLSDRIGNNKEKINLFIDIFVLDGTPNNFILRKLHYYNILFNRMLLNMYYIEEIDLHRKRTIIEKMMIFIAKILPIKRIINPRKKLYKIDNLLKMFDYNKSQYVANFMGPYRYKEVFLKSYIANGKKYKFEDIMAFGPSDFDSYLKHFYGDYMTPPKDKSDRSHYKLKNKDE